MPKNNGTQRREQRRASAAARLEEWNSLSDSEKETRKRENFERYNGGAYHTARCAITQHGGVICTCQ